MLNSHIRKTYDDGAGERPLPPDVFGLLEDADRTLNDILREMADLTVSAQWTAEPTGPGVWEVALRMESSGVQYSHRFPLMNLVVPRERRQNIRWAAIGFAGAMSQDIRKQLRQIQDRLQVIAAGGGE